MKTQSARCRLQYFFVYGIIFVVLLAGGQVRAASPAGDVVGKITVGYQGWFACTGDGAPIGTWWHYSGGTTPPTAATLTNMIHAWPDMRQYAAGYQTGFANFSNGQPARLFSSYDQQTVNTHFRWMAENGIDTAALQRFDPYSGTGFTIGGEGPTRNDMAVKVKNSAEVYGVKFYIMYDVSGWNSNAMPGQIEYDWTNVIPQLHVTNSPMYAMQNGKPVVCIWGFGFDDNNHPWDAATCASVINWFKGQGVYVIGGVPTWWRTGVSDSRSDFLGAYTNFDMVSPWMVGRIGNVTDANNFYNNPQLGDQSFCNAHGMDFQPCVLPGDTGQRAHGNFMWQQFYNMARLGAQGIYISMFDEFNEGNQISCTAEDASMEPVGTSSLYFTLDQDGTHCSSDYYLRLTGDGGRMFKKQTALTATRTTEPTLPIVLPYAPTNLTATVGSAKVALTWAAVTGAADVLSYNVDRATAVGGTYTTIATNVGLVSFTDTNVTNGKTYYYMVNAVNSLGQGSNSAALAVVPETIYQINSGGGPVNPFTADADFSGGSTSSTGAYIDTSGATDPAPQEVYQTERWGNVTYTFPKLVAGASYRVRLHFAEIYWTAAGERVFNVFINGGEVLTNYDIFADTGGLNKAIVKEFAATANSGGQITVQYVNIPGKDNAKSSGIEILPLSRMPTILAVSASAAGEVGFSWPTDHLGWQLQMATNLTGGNWVNVAGSGGTNQVLIPINVANGSAFYRLVLP